MPGIGPVLKITLALVASSGKLKLRAVDALVAEYTERIQRYLPCEQKLFSSEEALLASLQTKTGRTSGKLVMLDGAGKAVSSTEFAEAIGALRDGGAQQVSLAIGPADGWSKEALRRADLTISLGRITLPQGLARVVLAEQVYRALTILAGHPYHTGH